MAEIARAAAGGVVGLRSLPGLATEDHAYGAQLNFPRPAH